MVLLAFLFGCETDPYKIPITQEQAVQIAKDYVLKEEKWGDKVDILSVGHDKDSWEIWLSGYNLGPNGEHMAPIDAWDRYITVNDFGRVTRYNGTF